MTIPALIDYPMPAASTFPANRVDWEPTPGRAALLIHDMQRYFVNFYHADGKLLHAVISNLVALKRWCKVHSVPVIYTAQPHLQTDAERALLNDMWGPGLTKSSQELQQIVDALQPDGDDIVLVKWRYSAFQRSDLLPLLKNRGRDQLLIGGVYAHIGCMVTAIDAFMNDIQPFLIGDAIADFSEEDHRMALRYVATRCGSVIDTARLLTESEQLLTRDWLIERLMPLIESEHDELDPDENLIFYGLDSMQVMNLATELKSLGIALRFEELAHTPTVNGMWSVIERELQTA